MSSNPENKVCPFCAETIKYDAKVCRYCGRELGQISSNKNSQISSEILPIKEIKIILTIKKYSK